MALIDATTTYEQLRDLYRENSTYRADEDEAQCRNFISACIALLGDSPRRTSTGRGGEEIELAVDQIKNALDDARHWLDTRYPTQPRVKHVSFANYRC